MVGDIFLVGDKPVRISAISINGSVETLSPEGRYYTQAERLTPIPLTEEMMERNVDTDDFTWWETESGEGETVRMRAVMTHCVNVFCCDFRFVHEFQHALRLLGYNDIADNFKIK